MKPGTVLKDGYIFVSDVIDPKTQKVYGLAVAPKNESKMMSWRKANKLTLPNRMEMLVMYEHKDKIPRLTTLYWSSTESSNGTAWIQRFSDGYQGSYFKTNTLFVRCIRRIKYDVMRLELILDMEKKIKKVK